MQHCIQLETAYEIFVLDLQVRRVTQATLDFYRWRLTPFLTWCRTQQVTTLEALTTAHIRRYMVSLQERSLGDYSQLAAARAIRAWLNFCVREELLAVSPFAKLRMPDIDERILPAYSEQELQKLFKAVTNSRDRVILTILLDTGLRAFELLALNGEDIDLQSGAVLVRKGKGRKERMVYLGAKSLKQLRRYYLQRGTPTATQPVFLSKNDAQARLGRSGLFQTLRKLGRTAGVKPCTPHRFRRTFALYSLRNGMDIYTLQRLMGHEDLTVLRRYLALVEADLQAAHARFGVVDRL